MNLWWQLFEFLFLLFFIDFIVFSLNIEVTLINSFLVSLVPLVIPIPLIFLGLFTSGIQALIFATLSGSVCYLVLLYVKVLVY